MNSSATARKGFGSRGWVLIISMFLAYFAAFGANNSINIMANFYQGTQGWNPATLLTAFSIASLVSIVVQIVVGQVLIKRSAKRAAGIFGLVLIVILVIWGMVTAMWQYITLIILMKCAADAWTLIANGHLVANWFPKKRAIIMGITTFGIPLGAGVGMALMGIFMSINPGLAYMPFIITAVVAFLLQILLLKDHPEQVGLYPDNELPASREDATAELAAEREAVEKNPWTIGRLLSTKEVWFFFIAAGVLLMGSTGFMTQITPVLISVDPAFYEAFGPLVLTGVSVVACIGSFVCGVLDSKLGTKWAIFIASTTMVIACLLALIGTLAATMIALVFLAIFMGGGSNFVVSGCALYWGRAGFGRAFRVVQPLANVLAAIGPGIIAQAAASQGGDYKISFLIMAVCAAVAAVLILLFNKKNIDSREAMFLAAGN